MRWEKPARRHLHAGHIEETKPTRARRESQRIPASKENPSKNSRTRPKRKLRALARSFADLRVATRSSASTGGPARFPTCSSIKRETVSPACGGLFSSSRDSRGKAASGLIARVVSFDIWPMRNRKIRIIFAAVTASRVIRQVRYVLAIDSIADWRTHESALKAATFASRSCSNGFQPERRRSLLEPAACYYGEGN